MPVATTPKIGSIDPVRGAFEGITHRSDGLWCWRYRPLIAGIPAPFTVDYDCYPTQCAAEGNCPPPTSPLPTASPPPVSTVEWIPGINNTILLIVLFVGAAFLISKNWK